MQRGVLTATVTNTSTYVITLPAQSSTDLFSLSAACSVLQNYHVFDHCRLQIYRLTTTLKYHYLRRNRYHYYLHRFYTRRGISQL